MIYPHPFLQLMMGGYAMLTIYKNKDSMVHQMIPESDALAFIAR
jgi:hypothetical protein